MGSFIKRGDLAVRVSWGSGIQVFHLQIYHLDLHYPLRRILRTLLVTLVMLSKVPFYYDRQRG